MSDLSFMPPRLLLNPFCDLMTLKVRNIDSKRTERKKRKKKRIVKAKINRQNGKKIITILKINTNWHYENIKHEFC